MRNFTILFAIFITGCDGALNTPATLSSSSTNQQTLVEARKGFYTTVVNADETSGPPEMPPGDVFKLVGYPTPVGKLGAYVTRDPEDGKKHPAIVWITGGDNNSIGDVWSANDRSNDQSVSAFRKAGIVMMFPSQRGGNDNSGLREGFYGEVNDVLAATDYLAELPYVDPDQIYLGGHSTGGTLAMLIGEYTDRYRGVFSLGPVAAAEQYGGQFVYCDTDNEVEMKLRSPIHWMHCVKTPMFVFEGEEGNWDGAVEVMAKKNTNSKIQFFKVDDFDHFDVIAPVAEMLADQILGGNVNITQQMVDRLH